MHSSNALDNEAKKVAPVQGDPIAAVVTQVSNEKLDFDTEYRNVLAAESAYETSGYFDYPQNDSQKLLNLVAAGLRDFDPAQLKDMVAHKQFAQIEAAFANLDKTSAAMGPTMSSAQGLVGKYAQGSPEPSDTALDALFNSLAPGSTVSAQQNPQASASSLGLVDAGARAAASYNSMTNSVLKAYGVLVGLLTAGLAAHFLQKIGKHFIVRTGPERAEVYHEMRDNFGKALFEEGALVAKLGILVYVGAGIYSAYQASGGTTIDPAALQDPVMVLGVVSFMCLIYWSFEFYVNYWGKFAKVRNTRGEWEDSDGNTRNKYEEITVDKDEKIYLDRFGTLRFKQNGQLVDHLDNVWPPAGWANNYRSSYDYANGRRRVYAEWDGQSVTLEEFKVEDGHEISVIPKATVLKGTAGGIGSVSARQVPQVWPGIGGFKHDAQGRPLLKEEKRVNIQNVHIPAGAGAAYVDQEALQQVRDGLRVGKAQAGKWYAFNIPKTLFENRGNNIWDEEVKKVGTAKNYAAVAGSAIVTAMSGYIYYLGHTGSTSLVDQEQVPPDQAFYNALLRFYAVLHALSS